LPCKKKKHCLSDLVKSRPRDRKKGWEALPIEEGGGGKGNSSLPRFLYAADGFEGGKRRGKQKREIGKFPGFETERLCFEEGRRGRVVEKKRRKRRK